MTIRWMVLYFVHSQVCSVSESLRIKSGVWDDAGVFIYTTLSHAKYLLPLPSGDSGIVRTLDQVHN